MPGSVFLSFDEKDRAFVNMIQERACSPFYHLLNFKAQELIKHVDTTDTALIRQTITPNIKEADKTIVFVGENTHKSLWVNEEVELTIAEKKIVYAMRIRDAYVTIPFCLIKNNVYIESWNEGKLQVLANR